VDWITGWIEKIDKMTDALEHAKACGTLNAVDRSKQYTEMDHVLLVRAVNEAWTKIRANEKAAAKDQDVQLLKRQLQRYRLINIALTSIITGLAWEGLKALIALIHK
jgi:hypothetical protein